MVLVDINLFCLLFVCYLFLNEVGYLVFGINGMELMEIVRVVGFVWNLLL